MILTWENLWRFLWCWSSFCCCYCSPFVVFLYLHFLFDIIPHPFMEYSQVFKPILFFQPSPLQSNSWHFQLFRYLLTASATVLSGHFLPTGVFLPYILSRHFGRTCFYHGFTASQQLLSWKLQSFILIFETQTQPICLFDSQ